MPLGEGPRPWACRIHNSEAKHVPCPRSHHLGLAVCATRRPLASPTWLGASMCRTTKLSKPVARQEAPGRPHSHVIRPSVTWIESPSPSPSPPFPPRNERLNRKRKLARASLIRQKAPALPDSVWRSEGPPHSQSSAVSRLDWNEMVGQQRRKTSSLARCE
ncbi:hypothetical protein IAQ61_007911 [Plenodomus lingam]|uniref:uncharacterized protein n=1 Tax=Leptosphaeria maculans TaxID=5022 RepID=UPI003323CCB9|nr:hypothetical protein IAQ61_007911 [Plenodomus lingam]